MNSFSSQTTGRLAIAIGAVTLIGIVSIIVFFAIGGFFGPLNDLSIAVEAILSAVLAWMVYPWYRPQSPWLSRFALIAAFVGAFIVAIGSACVIFGVTGWFLAGLIVDFGNALIGLWLVGLNYLAQHDGAWPRRLIQFGLVIGAMMAIGLLTGPGILSRVDTLDSAPWFVNVGQAGSLGWFVLYPIWSVWLGRVLLSQTGDSR